MSTTETPNAEHTALDQYDVAKLVEALVSDQANAAAAVQRAAPDIARAVDAAVPRIEAGGRLIYVGAGTSGRLGLLDSVELYPTFSWPPERAIALLAGGEKALYRAVEGAEDSAEQGGADIRAVNTSGNDVVIVLAASGTTPYARGAIAAAREAGALTLGISNNRDAPVAADADIGIVIDTGAEVISGSTRMKAGTAQKITLNAFSSALMVRLNKVYGNLMVDLKATNAKLVKRAERLTMLAAHCDAQAARAALDQCDNHVKTAIVMIKCGLDAATARARLDAVKGSVRGALGA